MGFFGGGGAGGYSSGIGGQTQGSHRGGNRGFDGWDEEYLGKAYDADVIRRMIPYLRPFKKQVAVAFVCMILVAVSLYSQPFLVGLIVEDVIGSDPVATETSDEAAAATTDAIADEAASEAFKSDTSRLPFLIGAMVLLSILGWLAAMTQQLIMAWLGTRLLYDLRTEMYEHMQSLSLSFYDEMEVGRIISRLTSDVTVMQEVLSTGSLTFAADFVGTRVGGRVLAGHRRPHGLRDVRHSPAAHHGARDLGQVRAQGVYQRPHQNQRTLRQPRRKHLRGSYRAVAQP